MLPHTKMLKNCVIEDPSDNFQVATRPALDLIYTIFPYEGQFV